MAISSSLLIDIGGTNVRFSILDGAGALSAPAAYKCQDFPHLGDAIARFLTDNRLDRAPARCAMAVAAPPSDVYIKFVNQPWEFYVHDVRTRFGFSDIRIINDFTAIALSIPLLTAEDTQQIGGGFPQAGKPMCILGPGTGLGVSTLVPARDPRFVILTNNEGGHFTIPPMTDRESRVLSELRQRYNHVSAERVLSGPGIVNIYEGLCEADGVMKKKFSPEAITRHGLSEEDPYCAEALDMFCAFLGTAASNLCISVGAYGGVYLAGGILPELGAMFGESKFRKRFETKGRFSHYLESTPTYLIKRPLPAMLGLKYLLEEM